MSTEKKVLELINIEKNFSSATENLSILRQISLTVHQGSTIAITGSSGSGKSTLLGIMAGLDRPCSGEILFEETPIHDWNEDQLSAWRRQQVGFIFQNFRLVKSLSAIENVSLPLEILGHNRKEAEEKAQNLLEQLSVASRAKHYPHQLSGGEQQRVAIARAYAHSPKIIFADEPTGSLDSSTADKVMGSLMSIHDQHDTTLIVVTHDEKVAEQMTEHWKLSEGKIVS